MLTWKDTSSYGQGDKMREVNSAEVAIGHLRLVVHRHIHYPGKWLMSLHHGWIDNKVLSAETLDASKTEAVGILRAEIGKIIAALE